MFRAFILPVILMATVGGPLLYSHHKRHAANFKGNPAVAVQPAPWQPASFHTNNLRTSIGVPSGFQPPNTNINTSVVAHGTPAPFAQTQPTFQNVSQPTSFPPLVNINQAGTANVLPVQAAGTVLQAPFPSTSSVVTSPTTFVVTDDQAWAQPGMVPDFAKAETVVYPGDANGPNLSAQPMSFNPTIELSSLFRFDITQQSITSRWDRVSTSPMDQGLHGLRVAVVTGTNSWDLHGSLTYYFDANHRVQRITFRGWTGDATRLVQTLQQQHKFRAQPTHWAGLYLAKRGGLLMKHPAVIDKTNPVQQLALILEINNPRGKTPLSNDFQSLLPAALATQ